MDEINQIFQANSFSSYPSTYSARQKTTLSLAGKDIFKKDEQEINKEISAYLDIIFNQTDEEILEKTNKLKLSNGYSPIKTQKLNYGNFFI